MKSYKVGCVVILFTVVFVRDTDTSPLRSYINPLNNKQVDLFIAIDESRRSMDLIQHGLTKAAIITIATNLNTNGSAPYFGVYFYGENPSVDSRVPFPTRSATELQTLLNYKQYPVAQSNPSTLTDALNAISYQCTTSCRSSVARVVLIISGNLNLSVNTRLRRLENDQDMTVIIAAFGTANNVQTVAEQLVSFPPEYYKIPIEDPRYISIFASHIAVTISNVPRTLTSQSSTSIATASYGIYYTLQINTATETMAGEAIVMIGTNCPACTVYASLSQPNPIVENSLMATNRRSFPASNGYPNSLYYFRIPMNTRRFFVSFFGSGMANVMFTADVISLPSTMIVTDIRSSNNDLSASIG